jgi:protein phosphatase
MSATTYAALSDRGRVRENNEDRWFADPERGIYIVADGMGGAAAGEVAAEAVAKVLPRFLAQRLPPNAPLDDEARQRIAEGVADMSDHLREESRRRPGFSGMGATVVLAVIREDRAIVAHMGDSRAYLFRRGELTQLTKDHSIVQLLVDGGEISAEQASAHPARGQITRFVGMQDESLPEVQLIDVADCDRLVLCTDGLTGMVTTPQLLQTLTNLLDPAQACQSLVAAANDAGGQDNITVLIVATREFRE